MIGEKTEIPTPRAIVQAAVAGEVEAAEDRPAGRSRAAIVLFLATALALLAADLVTKTLAFEHVAGAPVVLAQSGTTAASIPKHEPVIIIPKLLATHLTVNEGAVFGIGQGGRWIFVAFSVIAGAVILVVFARSRARSRALHIALGCVLAGNLGNLYDRLRFGVVRDMMELFPGVRLPFGLRWPDGSEGLYPWIFNVADVCLVFGLLALMILMYRHDRRLVREQQERGA